MATTADRIGRTAERRAGSIELTCAEAIMAAEPFSAVRPDTLVVYCSDGR